MLHKIFIIVLLMVATYKLGRAFATGSIQLKGEKEPLRRQDNPRRFKEVMGIFTVIFILIVAILCWIFVVPRFIRPR